MNLMRPSPGCVLFFLTVLVGSTVVAQPVRVPAGFNPFEADVYPQFFVGAVGDTEFQAEWIVSNTSDQPVAVLLQLATPEFIPISEDDLLILVDGEEASGSLQPAFREQQILVPALTTIVVLFLAVALLRSGPEPAGAAEQVPGFMVVSASPAFQPGTQGGGGGSALDDLVHSFRYNQWQDGKIISTTPIPSTRTAVSAATSVDRGPGKSAGFAIVNVLQPQRFLIRVHYPSKGGGPLGGGGVFEGEMDIFGQRAFLLEDLDIPGLPAEGAGLVEIEVDSQLAGAPVAPFYVTSLDFFAPPLSDRVLIFGKDVRIVPFEGLVAGR